MRDKVNFQMLGEENAYNTGDFSGGAYKVATIKGLCASETVELRKFRQILRKALAKLSSITGWQCGIDDNDCVVIDKQQMGQNRHGIAGTPKQAKLSTD